jgi:hypothetical protein
MLDDAVGDRARCDPPGPADEHRNAESAFQLVFFSLRNGVMPAVGPAVAVRAVVGRVLHEGVVGDPSSSSRSSIWPTFLSWSIIVS